MSKRSLKVGITLASACLGIFVFETTARFFLEPSDLSYGRLFGRELPPFRLVLNRDFDSRFSNKIWHDGEKPNPLNLTNGDLLGVFREDRVLGYVNAENQRSLRGWWQSNSLGASSKVQTRARVPSGKKRVLVFGESFGRGARVPLNDSWSSILNDSKPELEIVNMAVDGYSMGQAFKRFEQIKDHYDYHLVLFMFSPEADVWREINTMRYLGEGWSANTILPRFILREGNLEWVPGPYEIGSEIYKRDLVTPTIEVRNHLKRYDGFYFPLLYESPPLVGRLITCKLFAGIIGEWQKRRFHEGAVSDNHSEGMDIIRTIFKKAEETASAHGKQFVLILVPSPYVLYQVRNGDTRQTQIWNDRARLLQSDGHRIIDLLPDLTGLSADEFDLGYDNSHYGVKTNHAIGKALTVKLNELGI